MKSIESEIDIDAVGFGALNADHLIQVETLERKDHEMVPLAEQVSPGGSAANTIYALASLGLRTAYMGAIGTDREGTMLMSSFKQVGTEQAWIHADTGSETGEAMCLSDQKGRRLIILRSGANARYIPAYSDDALRTLIPRTRLLHLTSFVDEEQFVIQQEFLKRVPNRLLVTAAPGAIYVKHGLQRLGGILERCQYAFFNREEITTLMRCTPMDYEEAACKFIRHFSNCEAVVITLGGGQTTKSSRNPDDGQLTLVDSEKPDSTNEVISSLVLEKNGTRHVIHRNGSFGKIVDTTGAGDAYAAGFLFGRLQDYDIKKSAHLGHIVAQLSILGIGARGNLPNRSKLMEHALKHSAK